MKITISGWSISLQNTTPLRVAVAENLFGYLQRILIALSSKVEGTCRDTAYEGQVVRRRR